MAQARVQVGATRERPGFGPGDTLIQFVDIPFTVLDTGDTGMVSIPANQFTAELAAQLIQAKADEIMKLHNLLGR